MHAGVKISLRVSRRVPSLGMEWDVFPTHRIFTWMHCSLPHPDLAISPIRLIVFQYNTFKGRM